MRRAARRLDRWEAYNGPDVGPVAPIKRPQQGHANGDKDPDETEEEVDAAQYSLMDDGLMPPGRAARRKGGMYSGSNGDVAMEDAEDLNDEDKELLGIASDREDGDGEGEDEELDDIELTMLGRKDMSDSE